MTRCSSEHVCERERRSSTSSIISPLWRRESVSAVSVPSQSPTVARIPLDTVVSGASVEDLDEKNACTSEQPNDATATLTRPKTKTQVEPRKRLTRGLPRRSDPECGGVVAHHKGRSWSRWAAEDVASPALVPALVTQALATGILDATTFADFATFASNQTGNAILLTLSAVGTAKILLALTAVSFGGFLGFAFVFGHVGHYFGVRRRAWLLSSTLFQTLMLVLAAILVSPAGPAVTALGGRHEWVVLLLFAGMSGAQVAMARQSSCQELPTAPMTSTFVDFVADHYLFAAWSDPRATPRNRRIAYVIVMIGGSFIGALMHKHSASWVVVAVSVGVKLGVLGLLSIAAPEEEILDCI